MQQQTMTAGQQGRTSPAPGGAQVSDAAAPASGIGFTPAQLLVLRAQIVAFKAVKQKQAPSAADLAQAVPPPLLPAGTLAPPPPPPAPRPAAPQTTVPAAVMQQFQQQGAAPGLPGLAGMPGMPAGGMLPFGAAGMRPAGLPPPGLTPAALAAAAQQRAATASPVPGSGGAGAGAGPRPRPQSARQSGQGPVYTLAAPPKGGAFTPPAPQSGFLRPHQLRFDVQPLVQREYARQLAAKRAQREAAVAAALAAPADAAAPGFRYRSHQMPIGRATLERLRLALAPKQAQARLAVQAEQQEVAQMPERKYKNMLRGHRTHRIDLARKEIAQKAEVGAARAKDAQAHRKEFVAERCNAARDARNLRNRGVLRVHERLARDRSKARDDDRAMRLEALKAHDFEAYQEMLRAQAGASGAPAAGERYEQISRFLQDTEEYLHRLASKIASVKMSAEISKAMARAQEEARAQGLSEEEVQAAAHAAAEEAAATSDTRRTAAAATDAQSRYYALAHSNTEEVVDQPRLLVPPGGARLREYQIVGLQWMVSLYNNHLNGLLADEMGLGKTVQVMSLIAYLMEKKQNFGPHLIIVPNAVIVNWKSELTQWLPSVRCVYFTGNKDERARKYAQEVQSLQFNVLVTTYEFIMRDRSRLSKVEWQYIVIDEAQRMKDRQSKLARDLDKFKAARRLLLSGTPLQNDLQELWSLLNLLLPEVFDDKKMFAEWFGDAIASTQGAGGAEADWLEKEKRVVVIHRLHQILEPFMLRRQVEDVESKLPPKVPVVVKVAMSPYQSTIYAWIKASGTLRLDPAAPFLGKFRREYASLNNKCMELRKVCNHPMLSYPPESWAVGDAVVRQCGKFLVLDRLLVKMKLSGHRVLLFSTMTKLLDLLEVYLRWRELPASLGGGTMQYLRIDGSTTLEDRESAIQRFNAPDSPAFIFLLSIRAAGRGLNLQSSDTVVIYDPDPNPKNEEQAIARSHRIGQSKEVRVIHLEAVADAPRGSLPPPSDAATAAAVAAGRRLYADSIESLVRNEIQQTKIEMANEVIDAGRFDQQTSMEERRHTLEALLQDEDRLKRASNVVPTWSELNRQWARGDAEFELFERLDREVQWFEPTGLDEVPPWLRWTASDLPGAQALSGRHAPDVAAELAALTGTVMHHHHHTPLAQTRHQLAQQEQAAHDRRWAAQQAEQAAWQAQQALRAEAQAAARAAQAAQHAQAQAAQQAAAQQQQQQQPAYPLQPVAVWGQPAPAPAPSEPEPTATATISSLGGGEEGEEGEEVEFGGDDEEEEVLDQNLNMDDADTGSQGTAPSGGGVPRVPSTAATAAAAGGGAAPGWPADGGADEEGEDGEEPPHKRPKKGLSVHFAEGAALAQHPLAGGAPPAATQQQQQQQQPPSG